MPENLEVQIVREGGFSPCSRCECRLEPNDRYVGIHGLAVCISCHQREMPDVMPDDDEEELVECPGCHDEITEEEADYGTVIDTQGSPMRVCEVCVEDSWTCHNCDSNMLSHQDQDQFTVFYGTEEQNWCLSCYESCSVTCGMCDMAHHEDRSTVVEEEPLCESCAGEHTFWCNACDERRLTENSVYIDSENETVCQVCFEETYSECGDCEEMFNNDSVHYCSDDDAYLCEGCHPDYRETPSRPTISSPERSVVIHNYTFKPEPHYFTLGMNERNRIHRNLFMCGVETEVEVPDTLDKRLIAKSIMDSDTAGLFYMKSDSSISYGFEIVSHPFSYDWMKENREAFEPMFALRKMGVKSYNTPNCGVHVHMSRQAFTKFHLLKFCTMFFKYHDFVFRMSRRNQSSFERYSNDSPSIVWVKKLIKQNRGVGGDRNILNLASGVTIECRLFKGTLNPRGWYGNIEFLKSMYEFTKETGLKDVTPGNYASWVRAHASEYQNYLGTYGMVLPAQEGWSGLCAS